MKHKFELIAIVKKNDFDNNEGTYKKFLDYCKENDFVNTDDINCLCFYLATKTINLPEDYISDVTEYFETVEPMVDIEYYINNSLCSCKKNVPRINQIPYSWIANLKEGDLIFTKYDNKIVVFAAYQQYGDLGGNIITFEEAVKQLEKTF